MHGNLTPNWIEKSPPIGPTVFFAAINWLPKTRPAESAAPGGPAKF